MAITFIFVCVNRGEEENVFTSIFLEVRTILLTVVFHHLFLSQRSRHGTSFFVLTYCSTKLFYELSYLLPNFVILFSYRYCDSDTIPFAQWYLAWLLCFIFQIDNKYVISVLLLMHLYLFRPSLLHPRQNLFFNFLSSTK